MEEELLDPILCFGSVFEGVEVEEEEEDDDDDFRSCCEGDDLEEKNEPLRICNDDHIDDFSVRMYFKGVSVAPIVDSDSGLSGIGVVMKRNANSSPILVQKKLDFFVDEYAANYLALMDGLIQAKQNKIMKVLAFTDSESLCDQFNHNKCLEDSLLIALRERILEHTETLESFTLYYVSGNDLHGASELARVAVGLVSFPIKHESVETCSICCEEKLGSMMITVKCNHRFCSHCMKTYVEGKLESAQVPVRCPEHLCAYCLTTSECKTFLPLNSYDNLEKALCVAKAIIPSDTIHCPHPGCSVLLDPSVCFSTRENRLECPVCQRVICVKCKVPWHTLLTCQQYRISSFEEIDVSHDTLHHVQRRRRCQQCYSILELSSGCCHMTCCWCGYEFCCSCGAEYQDGEPSCECTFSGEDDESEYADSDASRTCKQWAWDTYDPNPLMMDVYSDQERSEQALINRFLAGNFSLSDEKDYESPPSRSGADTCADVMKDLQELPWLERFVTLIDDTYNEEYL